MSESNSLQESQYQDMTVYPLHSTLMSEAGDYAQARALSWKNGEYSYADLSLRVTNIARRLAELGCVEGERVAILLPKTPEFVQAIYAVLCAGCAYIPLDASAPASRIQKILSVGTPCRLITCEDLADSILPLVDCPATVIALDAGGDGLLQALGMAPDELDAAALGTLPEPALDHTAAMLFTSGSTGTPKGVELTHRNIGGFVAWCVERFDMSADDRLISLAPFHFDLSTLDLFGAARVFGSVHLVDEPTMKFPPAISLQMQQQGVTMCYAAPTVWSMLESHGRLHQVDLSSLRLALFAGEVFPIAALRKLMEKLPGPEYYNLYGPTETNVCTYYHVGEIPPADATYIPIGLPCEHLQVTIRDEVGQVITALGEQGEVCVQGDAVTVGYFAMPEATAASRLNEMPDSYKTGDLGCWGADGTIKFLGRKDNQVKIRGNRIELSEVESVICSHAAVAECVVQLHGDDAENMEYRLIANVVRDDDSLGAEALAAFCAQHLTAVAVPTEVSFFDSFPRTSTGKIDRLKVAEAAGESPQSDQ